MRTTDDLLREIDAYLEAKRLAGHRLKETTFGRLAVNDGKFVQRLRHGGTVTLPTAERILKFISEDRRGAAA